MQFELKLAGNKNAVWEGRDPFDAIRRYQAAHPEHTVLAWRNYPRHGVFPYGGNIIEPGDKRW